MTEQYLIERVAESERWVLYHIHPADDPHPGPHRVAASYDLRALPNDMILHRIEHTTTDMREHP